MPVTIVICQSASTYFEYTMTHSFNTAMHPIGSKLKQASCRIEFVILQQISQVGDLFPTTRKDKIKGKIA